MVYPDSIDNLTDRPSGSEVRSQDPNDAYAALRDLRTATDPADGDAMVWDGANAQWEADGSTYRKAFTGVRAVRSTNQSVADSTFVAIEFTAADDWDTDGFHDPSTNPNRVTIPTGQAGKYRIMGYTIFSSASGGRRIGELDKNGTTTLMRDERGVSSSTQTLVVGGDVDLADGDYVELLAYQTSGGAIDLTASYGGMFLTAERLGD